eukprot:scaffold174338_cov14-Tisochrysis_lutea.AAC.1
MACRTKLSNNIGEGWGSIGGQAATMVPTMANLLRPPATFLHAADIIGEMIIELKVHFIQKRNLACTSKLDCSFFKGTPLEASCAF